MLSPHRTLFPNGVRVVSAHMADIPTMALRVMIKTGSAFESEQQQGISHFAEHLLFQGSERWASFTDIGHAIEIAGGVINGMTSRLVTTYWVKLLPERLPLAFDVLADILLRPRLDVADVDRERSIIIEEIRRSLDRPDERIHLTLAEALWPGQSMGRPVAGQPEVLQNLGRDDLRAYLDHHYTSGNLLVAAAGPASHQALVDLAEQHFGAMAAIPEIPLPTATAAPGLDLRVERQTTAQVHLAMGFPAFGHQDPRIHAAQVMVTLLGRGLSSRLFVAVRQRLGVAYSIGAAYADQITTGAVQVSGGIRTDAAMPAVRAIMHELKRLREEPAAEEELERARALEKARLLFGLERAEGAASHFGAQELLLNEYLPVQTEIDLIERVGAEDVQAMARELLNPAAAKVAVVGDVDPEELREAIGQ